MKPWDFTGSGNYYITYILDGWVMYVTIPASNANQLMMRWQAYAETIGASINSITNVERMF